MGQWKAWKHWTSGWVGKNSIQTPRGPSIKIDDDDDVPVYACTPTILYSIRLVQYYSCANRRWNLHLSLAPNANATTGRRKRFFFFFFLEEIRCTRKRKNAIFSYFFFFSLEISYLYYVEMLYVERITAAKTQYARSSILQNWYINLFYSNWNFSTWCRRFTPRRSAVQVRADTND